MAKRSRLCGGTPPLMEQPSRARDARGASAIGRRASPSRSASSSRRLRYDERPEEGEPPAVAEQLESMLGSTDLSAVERTLHECAHGAMDSESEELRRQLVQHRSVRSPVMLSWLLTNPFSLGTCPVQELKRDQEHTRGIERAVRKTAALERTHEQLQNELRREQEKLREIEVRKTGPARSHSLCLTCALFCLAGAGATDHAPEGNLGGGAASGARGGHGAADSPAHHALPDLPRGGQNAGAPAAHAGVPAGPGQLHCAHRRESAGR